MSVFSLAMLLAPVLGPVVGGFLSQAADWRWIFWLLTIMVSCVLDLKFSKANETFNVAECYHSSCRIYLPA
jgi:MFS family permease